jgi:hypothetical protein
MNLDHYREQIWKGLESGAVDYKIGDSTKTDLLKIIFTDPSETAKLAAAVSLIRESIPLLPTESDRFEKYFKDYSKLPFNTSTLEFKGKISSGSQSDVYLLESKDRKLPSYALKLLTVGLKGSTVNELAQDLKAEYESTKNVFKDVPEVLPKEMVLILDNPSIHARNEATVGIVERFYGEDLRDFFTGLSHEELLNIVKSDPRFRDVLARFTAVSVNHERETGEIMDLTGLNNLSIVKRDNNYELIFLDPHTAYPQDEHDNRGERLKKLLAYMEEVCRLGLQND